MICMHNSINLISLYTVQGIRKLCKARAHSFPPPHIASCSELCLKREGKANYRSPGSPAPQSTTSPKGLISNASVASLGESQAMQIRRQHRSTGCIPERDSPSSSPLALREKEHLAPPGPMHLEPDVELSLQELVTRHHEMLPLQVRVCKKKVQEEAADQVSLAVGGVYNLHFTVRKKIAAFTSSSGETFSLPAYSNAKCALVYNPERDAGRAFAGYTFRDVADLAKAQPTPVVVCATQPGESGEVESAIVAGEILALKSVDAGREGRIRVRAYSFKTESVKMLEDGCNAGFTTRPSEVQLPLQRIVKELSPMLPCCVHMFGAEGEREHSATLRLLSLQVVEWTLLVATSPQTIHEVLEVSITPDTEVKVKMVEVGGRDLLEIKSRTCLLQSKYHLTEKGRSVSERSLGSDKTYPRPDVSRGPQTQLDDSLYELPCNAHAQAMVGTLRAKSLPVSEEFPSGTGSSLKKNIAQIAPLPSPSMTSNGAGTVNTSSMRAHGPIIFIHACTMGCYS